MDREDLETFLSESDPEESQGPEGSESFRWKFPLVLGLLGVASLALTGRHGHGGYPVDATAMQEKIKYACLTPGCHFGRPANKLTFQGMCVGVDPQKIHSGASVELRSCDEQDYHIMWYFDGVYADGSGKGKLQTQSNQALCLDVKDHHFQTGTPLQLWKCEDWNKDQFLQMKHYPGGHYRLQWAEHPDYYVDVKDGKNSGGNQLQIWKEGPNQLFYDS